MKIPINTFVCIIIVVMNASCNNNSELQYALVNAGSNRDELERVLFEKSGKELYAAEFLISNMLGRYSYDNRTYELMDSLLAPIGNRETWEIYLDGKESWASHNYSSRSIKLDIETIGYDYLSNNINDAIEQWHCRKWNQGLSLPDFVEYLLPYRSGDESITTWRSIYREHFGDSLEYIDDVVEAARIVSDRLADMPYRYNEQLSKPHRDALSLLSIAAGNCVDDCDRTLYAMRSCGIPTAIDMFLVSPDNGGSHRWNVLMDNATGRSIPFDVADRRPSREPYMADYRKKGKVYRIMFGVQHERRKRLKQYPHAPNTLKNLRLKDVTYEYFGHNEVIIPSSAHCGEELYLGIFTPYGLKAVDFGEKLRNNKIRFRDIEPNVIYFPLSYDDMTGLMVSCGNAFMLSDDGSTHIFEPDTLNVQQVTLSRKMPLRPQLEEWMKDGVIGCRIEGSDSPSVGKWDTLYEFTSPLTSNYHVIELTCPKAYQYYRILPPDSTYLQLAEIDFLGDCDCRLPIKMDIYDPIDNAETKATDGDLLSYYIFSPERFRMMFRNKSKMMIKSIAMSARNDDNYVWPGQEYELLYYDGQIWQSVERKTATKHTINFDTPNNAVLWLRNHTKGREEQVFIYRDGRQFFNMDL